MAQLSQSQEISLPYTQRTSLQSTSLSWNCWFPTAPLPGVM
jgi:hypothetical protein